MVKKTPGLYEKLRSDSVRAWIDGAAGKPTSESGAAADESLYLGRKTVQRMTDEDLAEVLARQPKSKLGQLAASEQRSRESWRGPARWAILISALSFMVALAAFIRTL